MHVSIAPALGAEVIDLPGGSARLVTADGRGFELPNADSPLVSALRRLDGHTSWQDVAADLPEADGIASLRAWLTDHRLLCDLSESPLARWRVRLYGLNPLGIQIGRALLRRGIDRLSVVDSHLERGTGPGVLNRIAGGSPDVSRIRFADHWMVGAESTDLAIVAGPGIEADRAILADLHAHGVPTLVVSAHLGTARVGPLFVPRRTPCWTCRDLHIAERDPAWPQVLHELTLRATRSRSQLTGWAANLALLELMTFHRFGSCDLMTHAVCWGGLTPGISVLPASQHPACRCLASG